MLLFDQVSITPEVTSKGIKRALLNQLVKMHQKTILGNRIPAYDGNKNLYTAGALPFKSQDFVVKLDDDDRKGASSSSSGSSRCVCGCFFELCINYHASSFYNVCHENAN